MVKKEKKIKKLSNTPFDDVFRTLLEKCKKLIIPVINEIFHTDYSLKEDIEVLANEQFFIDGEGGDVKRVTDSYLKIRDNLYHIECQSTDDSYMIIRMFEYDVHIALDNVFFDENNVYTIELPQSAVIVLRDNINFGNSLRANLKVPKFSSSDTYYENIQYSVPVCNVAQYSKDEICEKNLLFLTPYYIIRFEKRLAEINEDANQLNELKAEYQMLYDEIAELAKKEGLARDYLHDIICLTEKIIEHVAKDMENVRREVISMGGNVLKLDREILVENAEERGIQIGQENFGKLMLAMIEDNCSQEELQRLAKNEVYRKEMFEKYNIV